MPHKIYIGNVPERAIPEDYKDFFAKCGTIVNIEAKNGFGFVVSVTGQPERVGSGVDEGAV